MCKNLIQQCLTRDTVQNWIIPGYMIIKQRECSSGCLPTRPPAILPHDELRATEVFIMLFHSQVLVRVQLRKQFTSIFQKTTVSTGYKNQSLLDQLLVAQPDRIPAPFETGSSLLCSQKRIASLGPEKTVYISTDCVYFKFLSLSVTSAIKMRPT